MHPKTDTVIYQILSWADNIQYTVYTCNIRNCLDIYQREFNPKKRYDILEGQDAKSRFGAAITGLGDINYDGYKGIPFKLDFSAFLTGNIL